MWESYSTRFSILSLILFILDRPKSMFNDVIEVSKYRLKLTQSLHKAINKNYK